jgi:hypothetical protein
MDQALDHSNPALVALFFLAHIFKLRYSQRVVSVLFDVNLKTWQLLILPNLARCEQRKIVATVISSYLVANRQ